MADTRWTPEEDAFVTEHYEVRGSQYCAEQLNRTVSAIQLRARLLRNVAAIEGDEAAVRLLLESLPTDQTLKRLCERTGFNARAIATVLAKRGLKAKRPPQLSPYDAQRDAITADYLSGNYTIAELCAKHQLAPRGLYSGLKRWGVRACGAKRRKLSPGAGQYSRLSTHEKWLQRYGKDEADRRMEALKAKASARCSGAGNPMYGKPSPQGSGNGWKGWFHGHFFRSLRELAFMIEMDVAGLEWKSAETIRIPYEFEGKLRTYSPDFLVRGDQLVEIKPERLHDTPKVTAKRLAAESFCTQRGWSYTLRDVPIRMESIVGATEFGEIKWLSDYETRVRDYAREHSKAA